MTNYCSLEEKFKGIRSSELPKYVTTENGQIGYKLPTGFVSQNQLNEAFSDAAIDLAIERACLRGDLKTLKNIFQK